MEKAKEDIKEVKKPAKKAEAKPKEEKLEEEK